MSKQVECSRQLYSFCNVFWDEISELILAGHTAGRACDLVYEAYGHSTGVTEILRRMAVDRKARLWLDCIAVWHFQVWKLHDL